MCSQLGPSCGQFIEFLWLPVAILLANDNRKMSAFNRLLDLPEGKQYHFFICHVSQCAPLLRCA